MFIETTCKETGSKEQARSTFLFHRIELNFIYGFLATLAVTGL